MEYSTYSTEGLGCLGGRQPERVIIKTGWTPTRYLATAGAPELQHPPQGPTVEHQINMSIKAY